MNPLAKKKERTLAREYLRKRPDCTYEELIKDLGITSLSKPYFFNLRGILRKSGVIPVGNGSKRGRKKDTGKGQEKPVNGKPVLVGTHIEIMETVDAAGMTQEIKDHWKSGVLPLLQRLLPNGKGVTLVFLSDPPSIEVRRAVSK